MRRTKPDEADLVCVEHRTPLAWDQTVSVDLRDRDRVASVVASASPDVVVHLASRVDDRSSIVDAAANLVEVGVPVVLSSTEAVFRGDGRWRAETDPAEPIWDYGAWKAEAERIVTGAGGAVVRLPLMCSLDPPDRMTSAILTAVRTGSSPGWYREEVRLAAWAEDVAQGMWRIASHTGRSGVWHLMGPDPFTRPLLAAALATHLGLDDPGHPVSSPPPDTRPRTLLLTDQRARDEIDWDPRPIGTP
jgi:dTDP-4-dehydrorhamnose reductase